MCDCLHLLHLHKNISWGLVTRRTHESHTNLHGQLKTFTYRYGKYGERSCKLGKRKHIADPLCLSHIEPCGFHVNASMKQNGRKLDENICLWQLLVDDSDNNNNNNHDRWIIIHGEIEKRRYC